MFFSHPSPILNTFPTSQHPDIEYKVCQLDSDKFTLPADVGKDVTTWVVGTPVQHLRGGGGVFLPIF